MSLAIRSIHMDEDYARNQFRARTPRYFGALFAAGARPHEWTWACPHAHTSRLAAERCAGDELRARRSDPAAAN